MTAVERTRARFARLLHVAWLVLTLRRPRGLRVNPLFDEAWYRETYQDAPLGRRAAYAQFRRLALTEGRHPNEHFDTGWYLERYPDVGPSGVHPIDHYLEYGWLEGRDPGPRFDGALYVRYHPEAAELRMNPLLHQLRTRGAETLEAAEGRRVRRATGDLRVNIDKTIQHYRRFGARRTLERITAALTSAGPPIDAAAAAPVVDEIEPKVIHAMLERPREGAVEDSASLIVEGWAFADGGIGAIDLYVDGLPAGSATRDLHRPDVAATRRAPRDASRSGFHARLPLDELEPGTHVLQVVMRDTRGHVRVLVRAFESMEPGTLHHRYFLRSLPTSSETAELLADLGNRPDPPAIQLVVIDRGGGDLAATLASVGAQVHPAWRCTILTTPSGVAGVESALLEMGRPETPTAWTIVTDPISILPLQRAGRRFVGFLHAGEVLSPAALLRWGSLDIGPATGVIYSDHDRIDDTGRHVEPWYVGDWAPHHVLAQDYVGGVFLAHDDERLRRLVTRLLAAEDPSWRYGLLLQLTDDPTVEVRHVPEVLWSRPTAMPDGDDGWPDAGAAAELAAVEAALTRRGTEAVVETVASDTLVPVRRIRWPLSHEPLVSLVIPTTGRRDLVEATLASLDRSTAYPQVERIFVDNSRGAHADGIRLLHRSGATVVERDQPFNWAALSNDGASQAHGELLLFLNDDLRADDPAWLTKLVRLALVPDVGVVGPLLRYPDGRIQHAGVFTVGHGGGAVHLFHGLDPDGGLHLDLHRVTREVSAVTGACLMVGRRDFEDAGGFDEDLAVVGNDVDLCLRIARQGKRTLWTPEASLVHEESASRASVNHLPDEDRMWRRWSQLLLAGDPYYNPNLAPDRVDGAVAWSRVAIRPDPVAPEDRARGVNLVGYIRAEMGVGEATRGEALALTAAGIPFGIIDHRFGNPSRMGDGSWQHKVIGEPVYATNLIHINADVLPEALEHLPATLRDGRRDIGYWTWELPRFPARFEPAFDLVDEVWVPSTFVQRAVAAAAPDGMSVRVVPHVVRAPSRRPLARDHFGLPADAYQFLVMYDTQSVQARKNPAGAIEAYLRAFEQPDASTSLVLKVNNAGDRELEPLRARIAGRPDVRLLTEVLTRHEVDSLIAASDCYVSLHRSEGFGLVIAEAMAQGRPVIATGWSGNTDFMSVETAALVGYRLVDLERDEGPYEAGQRWAEPDLEDAATWMRKLRDEPAAGTQMGARAADAIARRHSPAAIGRVIAAALSTDATDDEGGGNDARLAGSDSPERRLSSAA